MATMSLRKVGGSVMLAVPRAILDTLRLEPGDTLGIAVEAGRIVIEPNLRPQYTIDELLAESDDTQPRSPGDRLWLENPPVGRELI